MRFVVSVREHSVVLASGRRVAARCTGDEAREPVLFVHASGFSSSEWTRAAAALSDRYYVVAPDLLGYGRSDPIAFGSPISPREDLQALGALAEQLSRPPHVVGHSYGGYLAARLSLERPELVASRVLIEPVLFGALRRAGDPEAAAELSALYDDPEFLSDDFGGTEPWLRRFIDYWSGAGTWDALPETHRRANLRVGWKVFREVKELSSDPDDFPAYAAMRGQTTLVCAENTTVCARRIIHHLASVLPNARVATIAGAGHLSPVTHPNEVVAIAAEHLARAVGAQN